MKTIHAGIGICFCITLAVHPVCATVFEAENADPSRAVASGVGGRIWQTAFDPDAPVKWHWREGETSARMTVFDHVAGEQRQPVVVSRVSGDLFGSYDPAVPADRATGREYLYDFTLEIFSGEDLVRTETARVAYLPGVGTTGAGVFELVRETTRGWKRVPDVRLAVYDADWADDTSGQSPVVCSIGTAETVLPGTSGYFPVSPDQLKKNLQPVSLSFGTVTDYWESSLFVPTAMILSIR